MFDRTGKAVASAQQEFPQIFPGPGHVEHDPEAIWSTQLQTAKDAIAQAGISALDLAAIGVTNQRETTVLWDKATGKPIANAIVWQSRVTAPICDRLKAAGHEPTVSQEDRPGRRRVFLGHEDQAPARFVRRRARTRRARRSAVRDHRHVS